MRAILLLLCVASCLFAASCAHDSWTRTDTVLLAGGLALKGIDYAQTKEIARDPNYYENTNGFLGPDPDQNDVDLWFAGSAALQAVVAWFLPEKWRKAWLGAWIGVSGRNVIHNHQIGVRP